MLTLIFIVLVLILFMLWNIFKSLNNVNALTYENMTKTLILLKDIRYNTNR